MIIDTHSHIGCDYYSGNIDINDYIDFCDKFGINIGFLMPTPWPIICMNGYSKAALLWEHENYKKINYFSILKYNDKEIKEYIKSPNPYEHINEYYKSLVENKSGSIKLFFIPLIHGVLDSPDYLEKTISNFTIPAIKMHGFGSGFSPEQIKPELIELLKYYDIPIILHTSVYNYDDGYGASTKYWRNECHPLKWADFLLKNNLRGVLNHGAALNDEAITLVNKNDGLMIGVGPDLDISCDYYKVDISKERYAKIEYLKQLRNMVNVEKILFDIDYNWNIIPNESTLDSSQLSRFQKVWNDNEMESILSKNALNFYSRLNKYNM